MAETRIDFDTTQADAFLKQLAAQLTDMTPVMSDIGELLIGSTRDRFRLGMAPDGTAWVPNSPATLARKRGSKPLIGESRSLSTLFAYEARPDGVSWGSNLIYAAVQQMGAGKGVFGSMVNGSPIPWGDIPARPFIGLSEADQAEILIVIESYLQPD